ncbi:MAG: hypothetical protein AAFX54_17645 [Pseudomonadota bacterium]
MDSIEELVHYLDGSANEGRSDVELLLSYLAHVYESSRYKSWLKDDQYWGRKKLEGYPRLPDAVPPSLRDSKHLLDNYGLTANGRLQVKIDKIGESRLHLTDGLWVDPRLRVYPFSDESEAVCTYARDRGFVQRSEWMIDPACGCGHHGIDLFDIPMRVSMDINLRAIGFARFNALLHGQEKHLLTVNDIRDGVPKELESARRGETLYIANMPFGIFPKEDNERVSRTIAQDGGDRGISLTLAAFRAACALRSSGSDSSPINVCILSYSLGKSQSENKYSWELKTRAEKILSEFSLTAKELDFELLKERKLWRVNGKKEQDNPMPVSSLEKKADCIHTYQEDERETRSRQYRERSRQFEREGFDILGYGVLSCVI